MAHEKAISISITTLEKQEQTIDKEKKRLFNFIRSRVNSMEDAEDILQDVLFQFVSGYGAIDSIERATSWLFKVARNKIVDLYRKKNVRSGQVSLSPSSSEGDENQPLSLVDILPNTDSSPEDAYFRDLIWDAVTDGLDTLPAEQREVFIMHEFDDMSFKQISEVTGEQVNTLLSRKRYAVLSLRKLLEDLYNDI